MTPTRKAFIALLGLDGLSVLIVFNVISIFRGVSNADHLIVLPLVGPMLALVFAIYLVDGYKARTDMMSLDYTNLHAIALLSAMLFTLLMTYALIPAGYELQSSRGVIASSYLLLIPLTLSYRRLIYRRGANARGELSLVFLGDAANCRAFQEECIKIGMTQPVVFSVVTASSASPFVPEGLKNLRAFAEVIDDIQHNRLAVEAIILRESSRELKAEISEKLLQLYFGGVPTYTLELFHQVYWRKIPLYRLNQTWLFQEGFQIAREPVFGRLKRSCDVVLALLGLVLASPFIFFGGLAVWLWDHGPIFFSQDRIGKNHVPFRLYKLRTMKPHDGSGSLYTSANDSRITPIGRFLRATRIDEFPQLLNVLHGDMSLIGPRAEWDRLVANYERDIPCYHFRHLVKPGITGWAQVNYPYGANLEDTTRKLEYDLYYIRHFSFLLDASIVLKTIHVMLFGKGR